MRASPASLRCLPVRGRAERHEGWVFQEGDDNEKGNDNEERDEEHVGEPDDKDAAARSALRRARRGWGWTSR